MADGCMINLEELPVPSFYLGPPGVHALASMMESRTNAKRAARHPKAVVDFLPLALQNPETEVLYGLAGYLHCLLLVKAQVAPALLPNGLQSAMETVFNTIIERGLKEGGEISNANTEDSKLKQAALAYSFHGGNYLGAAHGLAGVLYVLLQLPELCLSQENQGVVRESLDFLVSLQDESGNWPSTMERMDDASLVHWCHGAPGIIPTLVKAYQVYGDAIFLQAAERAGDCVWKRGLLRKGTGICHGISGSALSLLTLYRATGERRHLYRAMRFVEATWHPKVLHVISRTDDPQRERVGVPDHPNSLMEGNFGLLYAYISMERPDRSSFPGYDGTT